MIILRENAGINYPDKRQLQRAEAALQAFREQKEAESSEFAAEFRRLTDERKSACGLLESSSLTAVAAGCDAALKAGALRLLWLENLPSGRAAACFAGEAAELERALKAGAAAAKKIEEWAIAYVLASPAEQLQKWLLAGCWRQRGGYGAADAKEAPPEARRVRLGNAAALLECTDGELRELLRRRLPEISETELKNMRRQDMVERLAAGRALQ